VGLYSLQSRTEDSALKNKHSQMGQFTGWVTCGDTAWVRTLSWVYSLKSKEHQRFSALPDGDFEIGLNCDSFRDEGTRDESRLGY